MTPLWAGGQRGAGVVGLSAPGGVGTGSRQVPRDSIGVGEDESVAVASRQIGVFAVGQISARAAIDAHPEARPVDVDPGLGRWRRVVPVGEEGLARGEVGTSDELRKGRVGSATEVLGGPW